MGLISLPGAVCGEDSTGWGVQGQWGETVGGPEHQDKDCQLKKNVLSESFELSFIWGKNKDYSPGDNTSDSSSETALKR